MNANKNKRRLGRSLRAAIIGGGKGCQSVIQMVQTDTLGRFQMDIVGVADIDPDAAGMVYAREAGVELVTTDYRELYDVPDLDLLIELTGSNEVRDTIEQTRPRSVRLIDHFGARLFWELHQAEEAIIEQRNEMQAQVESERERITQIFDCIPDEILVVDTDMVVQDANLAFLKNNNVSIEDVRGLRCYELDQEIRGECQVAVGNCPFFEVMRTRQPKPIVRKHYREDGQPRFAAIVAAPLLDADGELVGMIEMTRDITHRIRLEEELKATEVKLQQFMENAPLATYIKNRQGVYVEVNPALCTLYGKEKHEIIGKTDLEVLRRDSADTMRRDDREVLVEGAQISHEVEATLNSRRVFLSIIKYPVLDAMGKVSALCGLIANVTLQKEAQAELDRTREYLQDILDNSPVAIITTDLETRIVSFNRGAEEMLGYSCEEVIGKEATLFYPNPEERHSLLRRVTQQGAVRDHRTSLLRKDGTTISVSLTLAQLKNSQGEMIGTVGISKDISHRKALMDQIIQSERLAAVGRLAAGVAHEINNPLAIIGEIAGYLSDIVAHGESLGHEHISELRDGLPKIEKQVQRGRLITRRLLSLARKTEARIQETNVDGAIEEVLPFLEKEARLNQVEIHRECKGPVSPVMIEEIQLQEVIINLIQNAIQALAPLKRGNIWVSCEEQDRKVIITVRDDGPGIDEEVRDRLFDPFVTTKPDGVGTGLGLSICYGIVKRYDGEIRVASESNRGSTFKVVLPAAHPAAAAMSSTKPQRETDARS